MIQCLLAALNGSQSTGAVQGGHQVKELHLLMDAIIKDDQPTVKILLTAVVLSLTVSARFQDASIRFPPKRICSVESQ